MFLAERGLSPEYEPAAGGHKAASHPLGDIRWWGKLRECFFWFFYLLEATLHVLLKQFMLPESADLLSITSAKLAFVHS